MNKEATFQSFLENLKTSENFTIPSEWFVARLLIAALLAYLLGKLYIKYGRSMSNRQSFASNFILLTVTTMIIITIVKSSLALSLGLVGALSIVRYRTAIKEPEELSYLFLSITIGLGLGADQVIITLIGFIVIALIIFLKGLRTTQNEIYVTLIVTDTSGKLKFDMCNQILQENSRNIELKRLDNRENLLELVYRIEVQEAKFLNNMVEKLKSINEGISIQYLEA